MRHPYIERSLATNQKENMMTTKHKTGGMVLLAGVALMGWAAATAAGQQPQAAALTETGQRLEAGYAAQIEALKAQIEKALPAVPAQKKDAYLAAVAAERAAEARVKAAEKPLGDIGGAQGLVGHRKNKWIAGAQKGIAAAEEMLKKAGTDAEREAAGQELAKWQANLADGQAALVEAQAALDKLLAEKPKFDQELKAAQDALVQAQTRTGQAIKDLGLEAFLSAGKLDAQLATCVVLLEATPRALAAFAQQDKAKAALVENLLADADLMQRMLVADGANGGNYGRAMEIYTAIRKASRKAEDGILQRLALAIALEHAVPVKQDNPAAQTDAPATVDPVKRYLTYEKAYLDGELDPAFKDLTAWDLRFVVDGDEPDDIAVWGRQMLRNYRPDIIANPNAGWRYVQAVATEVQYGSGDQKYDRPDQQQYQNIIMNGGVCGRRAFFGRFILRCFGMPTTARPQPGHGALVRWTPDGWVPFLGGGWGSGWTKTRYNADLNFLASAQARAAGEAFLPVKRAQWTGQVVGEKPVYGLHGGDPVASFWHGVSLYTQRQIIENAKAQALAAVGSDLAEANESKEKQAVKEVTVTDADRRIVVGRDGVITIPAVACSRPTNSTGKIRFMPSSLGGMQLHYSRQGGAEPFEYTFDAPAAGTYALTARVVTTSDRQRLQVAANGAQEPAEIAVPFTLGRWDNTPPVGIELVKGQNVLTFTRQDPVKGLTIRDFTLTPVK